MKKIKAVMMAGGFGTRIQPLTHSIPKPMLPIVNVPMMEHILAKLKQTGIDEVVILLYYKPDVIKNHFKDGKKWGIKIHYVLPDGDYGTAGAVGFAKEYLDTTFMIISGDLVTDFDFRKIIDHHFAQKSKLTLTLTTVENPLQFGVVITDEKGKIEKFLEKPSWGEVFSDTINTGIYIIEPAILEFIPKGEQFDFAKDLFPLLMEKGIDLMGYTASGYWRDVGNPDSYRQVHDDILNQRLHFPLPGKMIDHPEGKLYLMGKSDIAKDVEIIDNVVIGDGVVIEKGCRLHNVVIGDNTHIKAGCRLRNSVIWHKVTMGKKCIFDNAVICNENEIGDMVTAKAGVILAQGCKVGKLAVFEHDVTIWPDKEIEPASIITSNVIFGTRYKNTLFHNGLISGKSNIEISCDMACKIGEAFGSLLKEGGTIYVGRDLENAPRMLKRAFVGGLLSAGVNIIDLKAIPPSVLRFNIQYSDEIIGGAYFRQSMRDPSEIEIILYNHEGLRLSTDMAKAIEKNFFKEQFRRVEHQNIGSLTDDESVHEKCCTSYKNRIKELIDHNIIRGFEFKVAIDLLYGITRRIVPEVLTELQIENIILNAYHDSIKLANLNHYAHKNCNELATIVPSLGYQAGFMIYPHGQRLAIISDKGEKLDKIQALIVVLTLLEFDGLKENRTYRVFLPTWAPDMMDRRFDHLKIDRGKYYNFDAKTFKKYDLIATTDGNFAFSEFALHRDAIYASLKVMELLCKHHILISRIDKVIFDFFYHFCRIPCPQHKKGKMMRKFIQLAKGRRHSTTDGVKIWESDHDWILMIPDQYSDHLNFYIQAEDKERGMELHDRYRALINEWMEE